MEITSIQHFFLYLSSTEKRCITSQRRFGALVVAFPSFSNFFMEGHFLQPDLSHPCGFLWLEFGKKIFFLCISDLKFYVYTLDMIHGIFFPT